MAIVHDEDLLQAQRRLRARVLEGHGETLPGALDLAAHMLVYLDDEARCWQLMLDWIRATLEADRVLGIPRNAREEFLVDMRTHAVVAVCDAGTPLGLVLCGWRDARPGWTPPQLARVEALAGRMLGPILAAAGRLGRGACAAAPARQLIDGLTPGEMDVARLVVTGMSYKEIAHRLNRSFSTVDHRLRAIREKLGARSTARMVALLTDLLDVTEANDRSGPEIGPARFVHAQLRQVALVD